MQQAKIWFSAVTPATNDISSLVTFEHGEKCALTSCDVACLRRFDPNGPSWYVKVLLSSDWILYEISARFYDVLLRLVWPYSWWNPAVFAVCTAACRISLKPHFTWEPALNIHFPHLQGTRDPRGVQFCCTAVPAPLGIPQQDRDLHMCDREWTTWPWLRDVEQELLPLISSCTTCKVIAGCARTSNYLYVTMPSRIWKVSV